MKILHTADWHVRDQDLKEIRNSIDFLIRTAKEEKIELFLIAGDIADSKNIKFESESAKFIIQTILRMSDIAPVIILQGTNSHDGNIPELCGSLKGKFDIIVSTFPEVITLNAGNLYKTDPFEHSDLLIFTCPPPEKKWLTDIGGIEETNKTIAEYLKSIFSNYGHISKTIDTPCVFTGHFNISGSKISDKQELTGYDIEVGKDDLMLCSANLYCMGHIHKKQNFGDDPIFYSGSIYQKTYGELDPKGFYIHEILPYFGDKYYSKRTFINVPYIKRFVYDYDLTIHGYNDQEWIIPDFQSLKPCKVKINIKVWQDQVKNVAKDELRQQILNAGASECIISFNVVPREIVRDTKVYKAKDLAEKIQALSDMRGEQVPDGVIEASELLDNEFTTEEIIDKVDSVNNHSLHILDM